MENNGLEMKISWDQSQDRYFNNGEIIKDLWRSCYTCEKFIANQLSNKKYSEAP